MSEVEELIRQLAVEKERADYAWRNTRTVEAARQEEMRKRDEFEAMYVAQCQCTDEWAEKYRAEVERKADATLAARVAELEQALATTNSRLAQAQTPNVEVQGPTAASSRPVPLDAVVGRRKD